MPADPDTPVPQGGAPSSLDLSNPKDRGLLRVAMADWPKRFRAITPEKRDNWVNELEDVRATIVNIATKPDAPDAMKLDAAREFNNCIRTSAMLDAMQQKDEHAHAAGKLKDQHHLESLAQAERHHQEKLEAGKKQGPGSAVPILIVDARTGAQEHVNLREYYRRTVIDAPEGTSPSVSLPAPDGGGPGPEQGR